MPDCACGCGCATSLARVTNRILGYVKGQPMRFRPGHNMRGRSSVWYPKQHIGNNRSKAVHQLRAEAALGRALRDGERTHHADGSRRVDVPLVICPSHSYHMLLHARMRVQVAGGDPDRDAVCSTCQQLKPRTEFYMSRTSVLGVRSQCKVCHQRGIRHAS